MAFTVRKWGNLVIRPKVNHIESFFLCVMGRSLTKFIKIQPHFHHNFLRCQTCRNMLNHLFLHSGPTKVLFQTLVLLKVTQHLIFRICHRSTMGKIVVRFWTSFSDFRFWKNRSTIWKIVVRFYADAEKTNRIFGPDFCSFLWGILSIININLVSVEYCVENRV